jgi:arginine:pyruvate transaminase
MTGALPPRPIDPDSGLVLARRVDGVAGEGSKAWAVHHRARQMEEAGEDVIVLSIGDPDFDTPAPIVEAAVDALRGGRTHYSAARGIEPLRQAIAGYYGAIAGIDVDPERVIAVNGGQAALFVSLMCITEPGDRVIVPEPAYPTYGPAIGAAGGRMVSVALKPERDFHLDPADIEAAIDGKTRALLINFPHNPTGATLRQQDIDGLAQLCRRHDLWLISDEVYADLIFDGRHLSPAAHPDLADRTLVIGSFSKSHAMCGWRLGWVMAPGALAGHLGRMVECVFFGGVPFIQDAAVVALSGPQTETAAMRAAFRARRDRVVGAINAMPGLECRPPACSC